MFGDFLHQEHPAFHLDHAQAGSGLFPWGSHMYYHVEKDQGVYSAGRYGGHEYNFVWPYFEPRGKLLDQKVQDRRDRLLGSPPHFTVCGLLCVGCRDREQGHEEGRAKTGLQAA